MPCALVAFPLLFFRGQRREVHHCVQVLHLLFAALILLLILVLCQSGVSVIFSFVGRDFYSALSAKDLAVFQEKTANYAVGLAVATPLTVLYKFQRQRLALSWRQWMTSELAKQYYQDRAYYRVELDRDANAGAEISRRSRGGDAVPRRSTTPTSA